MSFTPSDGELFRESIGSHELEAELVTRSYEHTHPQAEYGYEKPSGLLRRVLQRLGHRRSAE